MILLLATIVVVNIMMPFLVGESTLEKQMNKLGNQIQNTPRVMLIDTNDVANYFQLHGYDTETQMEYIDIFSLLLKHNNILVLESSVANFNADWAHISLRSIEELRTALEQLKIDNPRSINPKVYSDAAQQQEKLLSSLFGAK